MIEYRAYVLDDEGHIIRSIPIVCPDDTEASAKAREALEDCAIELWSGARFVVRLDPER